MLEPVNGAATLTGRHCNGWHSSRLSLWSLYAICRLSALARFLFHYRLASDNIHEMLAEARPDAIVCTVQPTATAELVKSLLPLHIPLFIEKPPGVSIAEASSLASASIAASAFTFVAFNRRAIPSIVQLREWAMQHPVRFARVEMLRTNRLEPEFVTGTGIHVFDAIRFLMGDPERIEVESRPHDNPAVRDYAVRLRFPGSATAEISLMVNTGLRRESYYLSSDGTTAEATLGSAYSTELGYQGYREWSGEAITRELALTGDPLIDGGFLGEYENFFHLLEEGAPSTCSLGEAARSMQLAEAVRNQYCGDLTPLSFA